MQLSWSYLPLTRRAWTRLHASCLACHQRNLYGTFAEKTPASGLPKEISGQHVVLAMQREQCQRNLPVAI